jgi:hypothetical protein
MKKIFLLVALAVSFNALSQTQQDVSPYLKDFQPQKIKEGASMMKKGSTQFIIGIIVTSASAAFLGAFPLINNGMTVDESKALAAGCTAGMILGTGLQVSGFININRGARRMETIY